jgi:hypothetical protein
MQYLTSTIWLIRTGLFTLPLFLALAYSSHHLQAGPPWGGGGSSNTIGSADGSVTYYHLESLDLKKSYDVIGPVVMVVDKDISLGNQTIDIVGDGSLQLYFGGNISVGGKPGSGFNNSGVPSKMQLYGTHPMQDVDEDPSHTVSLNGNGAFTGVLYAPEVSYRKNGGGGKGYSQGSVVAKDITFNGSPGPFHYDEALRNFSGPFTTISSRFILSNYELLKAGDFAPSPAAESAFGDLDYDALFTALFESDDTDSGEDDDFNLLEDLLGL